MQVLVVEDEKRLAQALAQILKEEKYLVDVAYTGSDGLDYALSGIYDVIVLDVMLLAEGSLGRDPGGYRQEFLALLNTYKRVARG